MKNRQALTLLLLANAISGFAQGISMLSVPWYFTTVIKDNTLFGIVMGVTTLLSIFWSLYAGTIIDRFSRKKVFIWINIAGALVLGAVSIHGFAAGGLHVAMIILVF